MRAYVEAHEPLRPLSHTPAGSDRIFAPFQRLNNRTSHGGFGLGLAIVESIAAIHGGTATARPRNNGGLTITVTIPAVPDSAQDSEGHTTERPASST
ncbi:MAG: sensor histidine kinase, partial [Pseudonocardiales bacterium]